MNIYQHQSFPSLINFFLNFNFFLAKTGSYFYFWDYLGDRIGLIRELSLLQKRRYEYYYSFHHKKILCGGVKLTKQMS